MKGPAIGMVLVGLLCFAVVFILLVINVIRRKPKKTLLILLLASFVVFIIGFILIPTPDKPLEPTEIPIPTNTQAPTKTPEPTITPLPSDTPTSVPTNTTIPTETPQPDPINDFVSAFNASSETPLLFVENFTPSDKSSKHYRVEFRLNAYKDAAGKSFTYGEQIVDLISRNDIFHDSYLRVYMYSSSFDSCLDMVKIASPILDSAINISELQSALDHMITYRNANGYYYSNLGLLLLGDDSRGYNLMLKMKND